MRAHTLITWGCTQAHGASGLLRAVRSHREQRVLNFFVAGFAFQQHWRVLLHLPSPLQVPQLKQHHAYWLYL
jgi:hypothetical protein